MTPSLTDPGATAPVLDEAATAHALHAPVREPATSFADRHIGPDPDAVDGHAQDRRLTRRWRTSSPPSSRR